MRTMILATVLLATVAMLLEPARVHIRGEDAVPLLAARRPAPAPSVSVSTGGASTTAVLVPCGVQAGAMPGVCLSTVPR